MLLTIDQETAPFSIRATSPTTVSPGGSFYQTVSLRSNASIWIHSMEFTAPDGVNVDEESFMTRLPYQLHANESIEIEVAFATLAGSETFGSINGHVYFSEHHPEEAPPHSEEQSIHWENWLSVFARAHAPYPQRLSDALRQRLIDVTNAHPRNPHIFLADFIAYFNDYLNIHIDEAAAAGIAEELPFATQGVPLDPERRLLISQGKMQFYGIDDFQLLAEDDCDECDDVFQSNGTRDVDNSEVEV